MADTAEPALPRRPLLSWSGWLGQDGAAHDSFVVLRDGDPGYEEAYEHATLVSEAGGLPDWADVPDRAVEPEAE